MAVLQTDPVHKPSYKKLSVSQYVTDKLFFVYPTYYSDVNHTKVIQTQLYNKTLYLIEKLQE
jgi:hypothetical protein